MEPLYYGHFGTLNLVLITEVSSIQRSLNTLQYYTGTQNGVLIIEASTIQRFVIERFHCIHIMHTQGTVDTNGCTHKVNQLANVGWYPLECQLVI